MGESPPSDEEGKKLYGGDGGDYKPKKDDDITDCESDVERDERGFAAAFPTTTDLDELKAESAVLLESCLLYTSPSPRDAHES
eukprot:5042765-Prymnesium_polylepis.1